jgi:FtsH-binding integral membrane protein
MNNNQNPGSIYNYQNTTMQEETQRAFMLRVYGWMTAGLLLTTATSFWVVSSPALMGAILGNQWLFFGLIIGELALVMVLSGAVSRMSPMLASWLFMGYAVLNGVTLSIIFLVYASESIAVTFGITACTFGIMTLFGYTTQRDLTKLGSLLIMALLGMVLASIINLFLGSSIIYWITTYVMILIFIGLIAYDTQKLKNMSLAVSGNGDMMQKASILGALALYLDFINLFLLLLRIFGRRR